MADYYPLIARAISGLDPSAPGESRRALYERARAALIQQLRSVDPPLSESEITRERLALEEAVRKVESEAAQRAREARSGASGSSRDSLRRANPRPDAAPTTIRAVTIRTATARLASATSITTRTRGTRRVITAAPLTTAAVTASPMKASCGWQSRRVTPTSMWTVTSPAGWTSSTGRSSR